MSIKTTKPPFQIMGIVNITPDSFSDGGLFLSPKNSIEHIHRLIDDGVDILDLGAESARPQANPLSAKEEWDRLLPVLKALARDSISLPISIDTYRTSTMLKAMDWGATIFNNIKGVKPSAALEKIAKQKCQYIAMHMWKSPAKMQVHPLSGLDAFKRVDTFFADTYKTLLAAGFKKEQVWMDPGIGFGKDDTANFTILQNIPYWQKKYKIAVGISRKAFIGRLFSIAEPKDRDNLSKMLELGLGIAGVSLIRTHDVRGLVKLRSLIKHSQNKV